MAEEMMGSFEDLKAQCEEEDRKAERKAQADRLDRGVKNLAERVLDAESRGDENTYFILKTFLDLAIDVQETITNLTSISDAMSCLTDAIGFIDSTLQVDDMLMEQTLSTKYGFFYKIKKKRKMRKVIRNNAARVEALMNSVTMKYEMATAMATAMAGLGVKLKKKMDNSSAKAKKKAEKKGLTATMSQTASKGDAYLEKLRAEKGLAGGGAPSGATSGAGSVATPSTGAADVSSGNYDDIL